MLICFIVFWLNAWNFGSNEQDRMSKIFPTSKQSNIPVILDDSGRQVGQVCPSMLSLCE